jgi:broad specificity phosphatase PhoE
MKRIFLLRHGEYAFISRGGHLVNDSAGGLSQKGIQQSEALARLFEPIQINGLYASPLERTFQTAKIIAKNIRLDVEIVLEFKELDIGNHEGKTICEMTPPFDAFLQDPFLKFPGGESLYDLEKRCLNTYHRIVEEPKRSIIIVAHAAVNRVILCDLLGLGLSHFARIEQDAACVNIIDYFENRPVVKLLNFTSYDALKRELIGDTLDLKPHAQISG